MSSKTLEIDTMSNEDLAAVYQKTSDRNLKNMIVNQVTKNCKAVIWSNIKRVGRSSDKEDLFQSGVIGIIRSLEKYDPSFGASFKTYAHNWVFAEIAAETNNSTGVKMADADGLRIRTSGNKTAAVLAQRLGREPTIEELAAELEVKEESLRASLSLRSFVSLDAPITSSEETSVIGDTIESNDPDAESVIHQKILLERIKEFADSLNEKQKAIFYDVIIEGGFAAENARQFDITRQRADQIKKEVYKKFEAFCRKNKIDAAAISI